LSEISSLYKKMAYRGARSKEDRLFQASEWQQLVLQIPQEVVSYVIHLHTMIERVNDVILVNMVYQEMLYDICFSEQ
jgi:hypothetical protein